MQSETQPLVLASFEWPLTYQRSGEIHPTPIGVSAHRALAARRVRGATVIRPPTITQQPSPTISPSIFCTPTLPSYTQTKTHKNSKTMKYPKLPTLFQPSSRRGNMGSASSSSSSSSSPKKSTSPASKHDCPISARVPVLPLTILRSDEERGRPLSRKMLTSSSYSSSATERSRVSSEQRPRRFSYYDEVVGAEQQERR
ncbi:hypothetical protein L207DRAFT_98266 [Hyaloscypha variabilis F]|uniref:Uncharacterized protein n=1 Tax=Hyaloscypha variabilis (strain UAMH 11265 / GT02V1 / F) TaxID=1149755 RepID=A0A2J6RBS7_HYAVF|nr:hypothetical protein L207DRAFT_98266 [Hyaloscypha variabilis F]